MAETISALLEIYDAISSGEKAIVIDETLDLKDLKQIHCNNVAIFTCSVCGDTFKHEDDYHDHIKLHSSDHDQICDTDWQNEFLTRNSLQECDRDYKQVIDDVHSVGKMCCKVQIEQECDIKEESLLGNASSDAHLMSDSELSSSHTGDLDVQERSTDELENSRGNCMLKNKQTDTLSLIVGGIFTKKHFQSNHCDKSDSATEQNGIKTDNYPYVSSNGVISSDKPTKLIKKRIKAGNYKCDVCGKEFKHMSVFNRHYPKHTAEKPYKCDICGKGFTQSGNLKRHLTTHDDDDMYKNTLISRIEFLKTGILNEEQKRFSEEGVYCNDLSGKVFTSRRNNAYKPYECSLCSKRFSASGRLKLHFKLHTGETPYKCDVCGQAFTGSAGLKRHHKTHTDQGYTCDKCGKEFIHQSVYKRHYAKHAVDKPYKCDICGKGFSQLGNLKRHYSTHTGETAYQCLVCEKGFANPSELERHHRTHMFDKPHECSDCGKGFTQLSNLKRHIRTHPGGSCKTMTTDSNSFFPSVISNIV